MKSKMGLLQNTVKNGTAWTIGGYALSQLMRLIGNVIIARLLFQEAFALMAIVGAIIQGLTMFSDLGLGASIIQNKRGNNKDFLNTAWTLQVLRGILLATIATGLAWPLANFYAVNDPSAHQLRWLIPIVAIATLFEGTVSTKIQSAVKHLDLGRLTIFDLSCQLFGILVMIGLAWWTRSVYAMAWSAVAAALLRSTLSHLLLRGERNSFHWDPSSVREIIHFGKWIFVSTIISFGASQVDKLVLARLFPLQDIGVYGIAASLAILTSVLLGSLQLRIALPLYARTLAQKEPLPEILSDTKIWLLALGSYLVALSVGCAGTFIALAYDSRYSAAGVYIPILAIGSWFTTIEGIYGAAFLAFGRARWVAMANGAKIISFCCILSPAINQWGLVGAVVAAAVSDALKLPVTIAFARRIGLRDQTTEVWFSIYCATIGLIIFLCSNVILILSYNNHLIALIIKFTLITLAYTPVFFLVKRRSHRFL